MPVNCGTLAGELFEAKMFGHEAGAFTGAVRQAKGRFEQAHLGTLFLDEVAEISPRNQANFLRVLEDGWFRRIGGEKALRADVRIITATNKDLAQEVREGRFRKDLYYRLHVIPIELAPLRERREAIPYFVDHFLERFAVLHAKPRARLDQAVLDLIMAHPWPGNVRQLKNFLERVFLTCNAPLITLADLPPDFLTGADGAAEQGTAAPLAAPLSTGVAPAAPGGLEPLWRARQRVERDLILRALAHTKGDRAATAELLEIKPRTLRQKMSDYDIKFARRRGGRDREESA